MRGVCAETVAQRLHLNARALGCRFRPKNKNSAMVTTAIATMAAEARRFICAPDIARARLLHRPARVDPTPPTDTDIVAQNNLGLAHDREHRDQCNWRIAYQGVPAMEARQW